MKNPPSRLSLAHKRTASISSAGVLAHLTPSTDLTGVDEEPISSPSLLVVQGSSQLFLTLTASEQRCELSSIRILCELGLIGYKKKTYFFSTRGRSTFLCRNWKFPLNSSFPHPATQHLVPVPLLNWKENCSLEAGRQAVLT